MKKLIVALMLATLTTTSAFAAKPKAKAVMSDQKVKSLISALQKKVEARKKKFGKLDTKIVRFFMSPAQPKQGENVVVFAQVASRFQDSEIVLEGEFDGSSVALEKSASELWAYDAGNFMKTGSHTFSAKVYVRDTAAAAEIKDSIAALDAAIASLNEQIAEETDEPTRNLLIAERDLKVSEKDTLVDALAALNQQVASESVSFSVDANPVLPGIPSIANVGPKYGPVTGGTIVTITGSNFSETLDLKVGGVSVPVTLVSPTVMSFTTPNFVTEGPKDIELIQSGANGMNAIRKNAFFAVGGMVGNNKPVAVAGSAQNVDLWEVTNMSGIASYDDNGHILSYAWTALSVPAGSGISTGTTHSSNRDFAFTPTKPGDYVWQLVVTEVGNEPALVSEPSITVVTAHAPANSAPTPSAGPIFVLPETSRNFQVAHGDLDDYQSFAYLVTKQSALGTATISSTGLLSFTAGSSTGTDSIEVTVVDNGAFPLSGTVSIPVSVVNGVANVDDLYYMVRAKDGLVTIELGADTLTSSHGDIVSAVWSFGDGTSQPSLTPADFATVMHDYLTSGTYTVSVTVTDSLGATDTQSRSITIGTSGMPAVRAEADVISGSVPLTVNFSSAGSTDDVGITNYRWRWGDGGQQNTTSTSISHTYNVAGEYRVRVRASDADGNINDGFVTIFAGVTAPPEGSNPMSVINVGSREVTLSGTHSFSGANSFDPNPSGSIAAYRWNFGDYTTCDWNHADPGCVDTGSTTTYTFPEARNYPVTLEVEGALGATQSVRKEVYAVNSGHAPRAVALADSKEGVAPFTVNFDASSSFDYDGTISSYEWYFGDFACSTGCGSNTATGSYTFTTPGNYYATIVVADDDGNRHESGVEIIVNSSLKAQKASKKKVKRIGREDTDRLVQRQALVRNCALGQAGACFEAGKMSQEDGNDFVSGNYFKKACAKGHQPACQAMR